jgi:hypothetical protein
LHEYFPEHLQFAKKTFRVGEDATGRPVTESKNARTLRSVLRECRAPRIIDYWSLDTEGSEFTILKSFPFDEYSFRVLTVEHNRLPIRTQIQAFLEPRGYCRIKTLEIDDCYVRVDSIAGGSWRSGAWRYRSLSRPRT